MSCTEAHIGKLKKIDLQGQTIEEWAKDIAYSCNMEIDDYYEFYTELVFGELYFKYLLIDDEVYEIIEDKEIIEQDIDILNKEEDGTYSYTMQFYNGGTCLTEMLTEAIRRINK